MAAEAKKSLTTQTIDGLEPHPVIEAQEKNNETTVEFCGFVGTGSHDVLRLYSGLDTSAYVEIPKDAVVHLEKEADGVKGKVRAFVNATNKVTEVSKRCVDAQSSSFLVRPQIFSARSALIDREGVRPTLKPTWIAGRECYDKCESTFAARAADVNRLKGEAVGIASMYGYEDPRYQQKIMQVVQAESEAVGWLNECLRGCPIIYTDFGNTFTNLVTKYLGYK